MDQVCPSPFGKGGGLTQGAELGGEEGRGDHFTTSKTIFCPLRKG